MPFVICLAAALVLHLIIGWEWTLAAGILFGLMVQRVAWLGGAAIGLLSWGVLLLYSYVVAPEPMGRMTDTVGSLLGGMPAWIAPLLILLLGMLLSMLGAMTGSAAAGLIRSARTSETQTAGGSDTTISQTTSKP